MSTCRTVFVVDDSEIVRAVAAATLEERGFRVITLDCPRDLGRAFEEARPDAVLLDAGFPGIASDELCEIARREGSRAPVIVFSDRPASDLDTLVRAWGALGSIPKRSAASLPSLVDQLLSNGADGATA